YTARVARVCRGSRRGDGRAVRCVVGRSGRLWPRRPAGAGADGPAAGGPLLCGPERHTARATALLVLRRGCGGGWARSVGGGGAGGVGVAGWAILGVAVPRLALACVFARW